MNDEEEDAKQQDPDRGGVRPGVETGPPSVMNLLRLGQGANLLRIAACDDPGNVESGFGNGNIHSAANVGAGPAFGPGFVHAPLPLGRRSPGGGTVADYSPAGEVKGDRMPVSKRRPSVVALASGSTETASV